MRIVIGLLLLICLNSGLAALDPMSRDAIVERIQPVGKTNLAPEDAKPKPVAVAQPKKKVPIGEAIYNQYCHTCHEPGLAGAPKKGSADWKPRLGKGVKQLVQSAIHGLNAMPPKGTCAECTEAEIEAALRYMLPK